MQLFNCKVRLAGLLYNEVRKYGVTAPEIIVMRAMHNLGDEDSISQIVATGKEAYDTDEQSGDRVLRTDKMERKRLEELYGGALRTIEAVKTLNALLPPGPLPNMVEGVTNAVMPEEPPVRTVVPKPKKKDELSELETA